MRFASWRDFASWAQGLERQHSGDTLLSNWKRGDVGRGKLSTLHGRLEDLQESEELLLNCDHL